MLMGAVTLLLSHVLACCAHQQKRRCASQVLRRVVMRQRRGACVQHAAVMRQGGVLVPVAPVMQVQVPAAL
jgi:hypothetical protein